MGLPLLDCFLNANGTALAQGAPLPLRFGAWMWGCGVNPARWTPDTEGADFELPVELQALDRELATGGKLRDQVSILSGFDVRLDGRPNFPHTAGLMGTLTGSLPLQDYTVPAPTLDTIIAGEIGGSTRFRSLEMSCTGNPNQSYSYESQSVFNAPEIAPIALYTRVLGPEFADPNAGPFTPDPRVMLRQSVLSAVKAARDRLLQRVARTTRSGSTSTSLRSGNSSSSSTSCFQGRPTSKVAPGRRRQGQRAQEPKSASRWRPSGSWPAFFHLRSPVTRHASSA